MGKRRVVGFELEGAMTKEKRYRTVIAIAAAAIIGVVVVAVGLLVVQGDDSPSGDLSEAVKAGDADVV